MSLAVQIQIDEASLKAARAALYAIPGGFDRALVRALNRGIDQACTRYKRGIASAITIGPTAAGKSLSKKRAAASNIAASLSADAYRFPLGAFESKQTRLSKAVTRKIARGLASSLGGGVRYRIGRSMKMIEGAFIATAVGKKGGGGSDLRMGWASRRAEWAAEGLTAAEIRKKSHRGVFKRRGASRLPIYEARGPSVWRVIVNEPELKDALPAAVGVDLNKLVNDQVGVELRRWEKGG